jgi:hypothetical protein
MWTVSCIIATVVGLLTQLACRQLGRVFVADGFAVQGRVRLAYQPPANNIFLSEQTSHQ